jgi:hypothetical protein
MKTIYILVIFVVMMGITAIAQDSESGREVNYPSFYARAGAGFGVGLCYDDPCEEEEDYYYGSYDRVKVYGAAYGTGANVRIAGGYMFSRYVGAELGISDFWGLKKTQELNYQGGEGGSYNTIYKRSAMVVNITPAIMVTPGFDTWNPYARFGLSMGVFPVIYETQTQTTGGTVYQTTGKYSGGFPLGYSAALGLEYKLSNSFRLSAEFDCEGMNYAPSKWEITKYTINDADHLGDLTTKQKKTEFEKSYDKSEVIPDDSPNKALRKYFPLSNVSVNIGARFIF